MRLKIRQVPIIELMHVADPQGLRPRCGSVLFDGMDMKRVADDVLIGEGERQSSQFSGVTGQQWRKGCIGRDSSVAQRGKGGHTFIDGRA